MKIGEYPRSHVDRPTIESFDTDARLTSWWLDHDGSRYRLVVVDAGTDEEPLTMLCVSGTMPTLGEWAMFKRKAPDATVTIAWSYLAEKLRLREGDKPGWSWLIRAATDWEVF